MNKEDIVKHIDALILTYPGKFENLDTTKIKECKETPLIAVNCSGVILFNPDGLTDEVVDGCLAFISLMKRDNYAADPKEPDRNYTAWNLAAQLIILDELETIGDFYIPEQEWEIGVKANGRDIETVYQDVLDSDAFQNAVDIVDDINDQVIY